MVIKIFCKQKFYKFLKLFRINLEETANTLGKLPESRGLFLMQRRIIIFFSILMFCFCMCIIVLDNISTKDVLHDAAAYQRLYKLKIAQARGTIYDFRLIPLVNRSKKLIAAVVPGQDTISAISQVVKESNLAEVWKEISLNKPFAVEVEKNIQCSGIQTFEVPIRYSINAKAAHIIGYVSRDNKGVCGIEKAYDDYLDSKQNDICICYNVDALNHLLLGAQGFRNDRSYMLSKGIVLNIDKRLQDLAEEIANKYITKGAVVITEVPNCEIRAIASFPSFSPQNVEKYLDDKNSPMINRAFSLYSFGSIFKLITAAAALESGINEETIYNCKGFNEVGDKKFKCFAGKAHGEENLEKAIAYSCNGYFIELANKMGQEKLLSMAKKFKLDQSISLANDIKTSCAVLPSIESLENSGILANFSFGQGKLMVSPVHVAAIMNAIASGGFYTDPWIVCGFADENMKITHLEKPGQERILSQNTADKIKKYMISSLEYGTSMKGKPEKMSAAAKTSTAQTGIKDLDGNDIIHAWLGGFFPAESPKYSIVIMSEGTSGGGESCGPVFREIIDSIYEEFPEIFID